MYLVGCVGEFRDHEPCPAELERLSNLLSTVGFPFLIDDFDLNMAACVWYRSIGGKEALERCHNYHRYDFDAELVAILKDDADTSGSILTMKCGWTKRQNHNMLCRQPFYRGDCVMCNLDQQRRFLIRPPVVYEVTCGTRRTIDTGKVFEFWWV